MRKFLVATAATVALALPGQALADMQALDPTEPDSAPIAANALLSDPTTLTGAVLDEFAFDLALEPSPLGVGNGSFVTDPPHQLVGFPTAGETYTVLSSGDVNTIGTEFTNDFPDTTFEFSEQVFPPIPPGADRDFGANDWTVLQLAVNVPPSANCLSLDYRFISEELPEFVGSIFNDAFFAEIDSTSWSVADDGALTRPNDFAVSQGGSPISVNGVGDTAVLDSEAAGTYFDAATGLITTKTPITQGPHTIYLSIFDANDKLYDSAVFLDDLRFIAESPATCKPPTGQQIAPPPPPTPSAPPPPPPPPPSNKFLPGPSVLFGKAKTSATLTVVVPGPGVLTAGSTTVGAASAAAGGSSALRRAEAARRNEVATSAAKKKAPKGKGKKKGKAKKKAKPKVKKPLLNTSTVRANQAGPVQITVALSSTGKAVLAKKGTLTIPVTLTFTPDGGTPASQVQTVTFKKPAVKKKCGSKAKGKAKASAKGGKQCKKTAKGKGKKKKKKKKKKTKK